jgi:hypothetical protein
MPERGCFEQAGIRRDRPSCLVNALSYHKTIGVTQIKILAKSWTCGKGSCLLTWSWIHQRSTGFVIFNTKLAFTKSDKSPKQLLLIGDNWYDSRKREKSKKKPEFGSCNTPGQCSVKYSLNRSVISDLTENITTLVNPCRHPAGFVS